MDLGSELVSRLEVQLRRGLELEQATAVLDELQDDVLVAHGLYFSGDVERSGTESASNLRIVGLLVRADGRDLRERDIELVKIWLGSKPEVTEFSFGPLKPANSREFRPGRDEH